MSLADFNPSVQQTFKETMAVSAGLTKAESGCVTLTASSAPQAGSVAVDIVIDMPSAALANLVVSTLSQSKVNTLLTAAGLPAAMFTSAVTGPGGSLSALGRRRRPGPMCVMASSVAIGLLGTVGHAVYGH